MPDPTLHSGAMRYGMHVVWNACDMGCMWYAVLLAPDDFNVDGPWPHACQGMQGTDSFYPYELANGSWAALVGTSMPWQQPRHPHVPSHRR